MPYLFAFLLLVNIGALGYFLFAHNADVDSPSVTDAKAKITKVVEITNPNKSS